MSMIFSGNCHNQLILIEKARKLIRSQTCISYVYLNWVCIRLALSIVSHGGGSYITIPITVELMPWSFIFYFMYIGSVLCLYVCLRIKNMLWPLKPNESIRSEMELQKVLNCHLHTGIESRSSARTSHTFSLLSHVFIDKGVLLVSVTWPFVTLLGYNRYCKTIVTQMAC